MNNIKLTSDNAALKQSILELRSKRRAAKIQKLIPRRNEANHLPLSYPQQRLWYLDQLSPNGAFYNIAQGYYLKGPLNLQALEQSLNQIIQRHEVLRTSIHLIESSPAQVISPRLCLPLPILDLGGLAADHQQESVARQAGELASRGFELSQPPLLRAMVMRLSESEHVLAMSLHHLISDGWSMGVLYKELSENYEAAVGGRQAATEELVIQYGDYAVWQREWVRGEELERQMSYWRGQLAGAAAVLELPTDRVRPSVQSFTGARLALSVEGEMSEGLKRMSRGEGVTLFMTMLAAYKVMLYRYSGQEEIIVGTPVANRNRVEFESLIGFFVNMLVMKAALKEGDSFRRVAAKVKEMAIDAYANQEVPFERVVEEMEPERRLSHNPLFQVMFALQNAPGGPLALHGLEIDSLTIDTGNAIFDLSLLLTEESYGLSGIIQYNSDLFDEPTISRMAAHFINLLRAVSTTPDLPIGELPMLGAQERQQLLVAFNDTRQDYPRAQSIAGLFEQQAEATPDAVAVVCQGQCLSYRELNERANQMANYLKEKGVGPERVVGVCLPRSAEMVIVLLGVLKAGGAYLPLDSSWPSERMRGMIEEAKPVLVMSGRGAGEALSGSRGRVVMMEEEEEEIRRGGRENRESGVMSENLAYVMYTSGSTGKPKASCITHRGVVRLVKQSSYAQFSADDLFLQFAPISFDASTFEIWGALLNGAGLVVFPPQTPSLEELADFIDSHQISTLWLTAGLFHQMVETHPESLARVKQLLAGGDALSLPHVKKLLGQPGRGKLFNGYGPTENTTFTCCYEISSGDDFSSSVPIGRPISNTRVYIVDGQMQALPVGIPGHLQIAGDGLARGYFNDPAATAARFIPDPFAEPPGERLYQSGDLARFLADGRIEFLGRRDHQVKVRGYRIEPGEIEAALCEHEAVSRCVVVARGEGAADKRLVAYIVAAGAAGNGAAGNGGSSNGKPVRGREEVEGQLRSYLREKLPEYMVPAAIVVMEELPLTASGKIDRRRLPEEEKRGEREGVRVEGSKSVVAEIVGGVWEEVLGVEEVGEEENFFELGGHSLSATMVVSRLQRIFQIAIPLRTFLQEANVLSLSNYIEREKAERRGEAKTARPPAILALRPRPAHLPLSFAQQRLWFLEQMEPLSARYNMAWAVRLSGPLNLAALHSSLQAVVDRHEVLRTSIHLIESTPAQVISPRLCLPLPVLDLSGLAGEHQQESVARQAGELASRGFELSQAPLLRAMVMRLSESEHVLAMSLHHLISDGWSMGVLYKELSENYEAAVGGRQAATEELVIQYGDYAVWQREWVRGEGLERQMSYWRGQLAGAAAVLELPTDRVRPSVQSYKGGTKRFEMSEEMSEGLKRMSRGEGMTVYMTLLAAYQVLLERYSGQEEISVGSPVAGRQREELEGLIGMFVNTVVMRVRVRREARFKEMLQEVREVVIEGQNHQEVPFEKLVEELQPERRLSHTPLFQVMFALQNAPGGPLALHGLELEPFDVETDTALFDVACFLKETAGKLGGVIQYNSDLFDEPTISRMAAHFINLLHAVSTTPDLPIGELPMLGAQERQQLLVAFNDTRRDYPRAQSIAGLFEQQAEATPDAVAVVCQGQCLSYRELNERANQMANYLKEEGVGPERVVGVCLPRSAEMVIVLLGVLKAGGAYLPLDSSWPSERVRGMIEEAKPVLVMSGRGAGEALSGSRGRVVVMEEEEEEIRRGGRENCESGVMSENLAYVMYTSGSTGKPKGVQITHSAVVNFLCSMRELTGLTRDDVLVAVTTLSFDIAGLEIYLPLTVGASVVIASREVATDGIQLTKLLASSGATVLQATPATWRMLIDSGWQGSDQLKVLCGGEALTRELAAQLVEPNASLLNLYGPTETTIWSTAYKVESENVQVCIGRPISNTRVYIVDGQMQVLPVGIPGHLQIAGDGLARGYFNDPAATAARFIPDPFAEPPGERLYQSGDLARFLADGRIEFLGRRDHQVKVRGYRIEPGEIEAALCEHEAVSRCVVVARGEGAADKRLVAYIVAAGAAGNGAAGNGGSSNGKPVRGREEVEGQLRSYLREKLPEYMVPAAIVVMEELPLTASGKVDRRRLPEEEKRGEREGVRVEGSKSAVAEIVGGVWEEVLGVEEVGEEENFFELGGHSLSATMVVSRLQRIFNLDIAVKAFFQHPTLVSLSNYIEREKAERRGEAKRARPPAILAHRPRPAHLPLSFAQQRLWFLEQMEPLSARYNMAWAVRLSGPLNLAALHSSLQAVVDRHEVLRTSIHLIESTPAQVISPRLCLPLPILDLSGLAGEHQQESVARQAGELASRGFELSQPPLLRAMVMRLSESEHVLAMSLHHLISDGWSMGVLYKELSENYEAAVGGRQAAVEELVIQYGDYAVWQREWVRGEGLERQMSYWRGQLAGAAAVLELPTDRVRPSVQSYKGGTKRFEMSEEMSEGLKRMSRGEGMTVYMTLLGAYQVLLERYSGQEEISVGSPVAGRQREELEGLIGMFVNTVVMRVRVRREARFKEMLQEVREVVIEGQNHQEVPFEKLVEELQPERRLSHTPLFQVMFAFQNTVSAGMKLADVKVSHIGAHSGTAKFDLDLLMEERNQQIRGMLEYSTDLFDDTTITRMIGHFTKLLESVIANPDARLSDLPLLSSAEQHQMLVTWNETQVEFPAGLSLVEVFQSWAERTPQSLAALFEDQQVTYGELNRRANRIAHALAARGVGPEVSVALLAERDIDFLAAILAIFKAGGRYLPLDPHSPAQRLSLVLAQSYAALVITTGSLLPVIAQALDGSGAEDRPIVVTLEDLLSENRGEANLPYRCDVDHIAYLIFTSGSTGLPKGVMVEHRGMLNHLYAKVHDLKLTDEDVIAQTASQCFDISVWQFLAALVVGGKVHVFTEEASHDPAQMLDLIVDSRITVCETVPSLLRMLIDEATARSPIQAGLLSLRWMISTGEALPPQLCNDWFSAYPAIPLMNAYGPTECSDDVTHYIIHEPTAGSNTRIPIGRAVANMRLYILDANLRAVPVGVLGELYIGGVGVSRGYLNQPDLTAERFIADPFASEPGQRLYKSGDYTRYRADGNIEFFGRMDHQVKVRGFRIELGEIEAALGRHAGVRESVVLAREDGQGEQRLVAYVVPRNNDELTITALRTYLSERLTDYLVPAIIMFLDAMPVTATGKIDRQALPAPDADRPLLEQGFVAPRSREEKILAEVWSQVLGLKQVGVNDNFFELGGDSILSIQTVSRANLAGMRITSKQLFMHQTIAELAAVAGAARHDHAPAEPVTGEAPLMPIQRWSLEQAFANPHHYNQAVLLEIKQAVEPAVLRAAVRELLAHHDALRLRLVSGDDGWRQHESDLTEDVPFSYEDLSALPLEEQRGALEAKAALLQASLNLSSGPLLRVAQFNLGGREPDRLLIIIHHFAVDGVSWRILLDDLQTALKQLAANEQIKLPPKTSSFKYWGERLSEYAHSQAISREIDYWLGFNDRELSRLPTDQANQDNTEASAEVVSVDLETDETRALLQDVSGAYKSQINDALLAALVKAFAPWTGASRLLIDLEGHGREGLFDGIDLSRTVGWFTSLFPVLLDLGEAREMGEALMAIKAQLRRIPHNGIGYGLLRYLRGDASVVEKLERLSRAEVSFNYLGQFNDTFLESSRFAVARESAGPDRSSENLRSYLIEVDGSVNRNRLILNWRYSRNIHRRSTIEALANRSVEALRSLIAQSNCAAPQGLTPSDFPLAKFDQQRLERVMNRVSKIKGSSSK